MDIFNSMQYELIPTKRKQDKNGNVFTVASDIVKLKFRLIDYFGLNMLKLQKEYYDKMINVLHTKIKKYISKISATDFSIIADQQIDSYLGNIYDQNVYKKQQMLIMKNIT